MRVLELGQHLAGVEVDDRRLVGLAGVDAALGQADGEGPVGTAPDQGAAVGGGPRFSRRGS